MYSIQKTREFPLYSQEKIPKTHSILGTFILRFITSPFVFSFILFSAVASTLFAITYNIAFLISNLSNDEKQYRLAEPNQMAIKHWFWLISEVCSFLVDQTKLLMGLFSKNIAIDTLNDIQQQSIEFTDTVLDISRWDTPYLKQVIRLASFIHYLGYREDSMATAALLSEPIDAIIAGIRMQSTLQGYSVNPSALTSEQFTKAPVLLIHGDQHNDTAFIPLLDKLKAEQYNGPIFTVNIPNMQDEKTRDELIDAKIKNIQKLYNNPNIQCVGIGHSSGADALIDLRKRNPSAAKKLLLMGTNRYIADLKQEDPLIIYIDAKKDVLLPLPGEQEYQQKMEQRGDTCRDRTVKTPTYGLFKDFNTGHLGLLSDLDTLEYCAQQLSS